MKTTPEFKTLVAAILVAFITGGSFFMDGGRIDFYYKPMMWGWHVITALCLLPILKFRFALIIREVWWLQLLMPFALCYLAIGISDLRDASPAAEVRGLAERLSASAYWLRSP